MRLKRVRDARRGVVLVIVLVFALLLTTSIATFLRRATVDAMIARNRDSAAQAEALARGGVRLAVALLIEDRLEETASETGEDRRLETLHDPWARVQELAISPQDGRGVLRLRIEDAGSRLNLNALFQGGATRGNETELLLIQLLEKVIGEMPGRPEEKLYDPQALARSLIDYVDEDELKVPSGDPENDYYQQQDPPYEPANRPLLSVEELGLVEGFDRKLVAALRPYVTVYPLVGGEGINPNTAPTWVLATVYYNDGTEHRLADEDAVGQVLKHRERGEVFCAGTAEADETCVSLREVFPNEPYPPPSLGGSEFFYVTAQAEVGDIRRTVETIVDRTDITNPVVRTWRVR
jgi:type II secretory pathway component PulK